MKLVKISMFTSIKLLLLTIIQNFKNIWVVKNKFYLHLLSLNSESHSITIEYLF